MNSVILSQNIFRTYRQLHFMFEVFLFQKCQVSFQAYLSSFQSLKLFLRSLIGSQGQNEAPENSEPWGYIWVSANVQQ